MTPEQIDSFRYTFKRIVYHKGRVVEENNKIKQLTRFDRNGSHTNAINRAIEKRNQERDKLNALLEGKTYDEWLEFSKKLSAINSGLKSSIRNKELFKEKLNRIEFN